MGYLANLRKPPHAKGEGGQRLFALLKNWHGIASLNMIPRLSVIPPKVFSDNQKAKKKGKDDKKANHLVFLCHIDQIGQSLDQAN